MNLVHKLQARIAEENKPIVVIGDAMADVWIHGHVEECQDGCPKFVEESRTAVPGGAANAERSISRWSEPYCPFGSVETMRPMVTTVLCALLEKDRVAKARFVDNSGKIVFRHDDDIETNYIFIQNNHQQCYRWEIPRALKAIEIAGAVLLSDYDKGFLTPEFIQQVVAKCKKHNVPCVADCKRAPEVYDGCTLKCNEEYTKKHSLTSAYRNMAQVIVTHGANTPFSQEFQRQDELQSVPLVNHVGAGDCFAAHLTLALAYGFSLREASALAHSAGRVYVQHQHNYPPYPYEIAADMESAQ